MSLGGKKLNFKPSFANSFIVAGVNKTQFSAGLNISIISLYILKNCQIPMVGNIAKAPAPIVL
jgi:hypothetical protein